MAYEKILITDFSSKQSNMFATGIKLFKTALTFIEKNAGNAQNLSRSVKDT
jgi:hypothetical protein